MTTLYDGKVQLEFDKKSHRYTVTEGGEVFSVPSVTQVLSILDKPALIQWAANQACEYLRTRILPGQSYDEIQIDELLNEARYNFRRISSRAKSVGSLTHEWIESYLTWMLIGTPSVPPLPINEQARNACKAAMEWIASNKIEPLAPEEKLYSRKYRVAGTMDWPVKLNGRLAIVDWKTSKGIYDEMILQADVYASIYHEMTGQKVKECWIVRIDKETAEVEPRLIPATNRKANFKAFLGLKVAYERMQVLKNGGQATTNLVPALKESIKAVA